MVIAIAGGDIICLFPVSSHPDTVLTNSGRGRRVQLDVDARGAERRHHDHVHARDEDVRRVGPRRSKGGCGRRAAGYDWRRRALREEEDEGARERGSLGGDDGGGREVGGCEHCVGLTARAAGFCGVDRLMGRVGFAFLVVRVAIG